MTVLLMIGVTFPNMKMTDIERNPVRFTSDERNATICWASFTFHGVFVIVSDGDVRPVQ